MKVQHALPEFLDAIAAGRSEIYNEFSLQHELGIFLRTRMPKYVLRFERNVSYFFGAGSRFTKREIDISIFSADKSDLHCAIELKYPRNGQHPEQMFSFCKDIAFLEELRRAGFANAVFLVLAEDPLFYRGSGDGIYSFFRNGRPIHGRIKKPTGSKEGEVSIQGNYQVDWKEIHGHLRYAIVEVTHSAAVAA